VQEKVDVTLKAEIRDQPRCFSYASRSSRDRHIADMEYIRDIALIDG
jgi:hypothetical protein